MVPAWLEDLPLWAKFAWPASLVVVALVVPALHVWCSKSKKKVASQERGLELPSAAVAQTSREVGLAELPAGAGAAERMVHAVSLGRFFEAERELQRLEQANEVAEQAVAERIRRVMGKLRDAEGLLALDPLELAVCEENPKKRLKWGATCSDGSISFASVIEYDVDFVTGIAGRLEVTCQPEFDPNVVSVDNLGPEEPADRVVQKIVHVKGVGSKCDDVLYISVVNCLNEPCSCVYSMYYTLPPGLAQVNGVEVPGVREGHARTQNISSILCFKPLQNGGFEELSVGRLELSPIVYRVLSVMPNFVLRRICRTWFEGGIGGFTSFLKSSKVLQETLASSPRVQIYKSLAAAKAIPEPQQAALRSRSLGQGARAGKSAQGKPDAPACTPCCWPWA